MILAFPIFLGVYGIIFSQVLAIGRDNSLTVAGLIAIGIFGCAVLRLANGRILSKPTMPFVVFLSTMILIVIFRSFSGNSEIKEVLQSASVFILALAIALYIGTFSVEERIPLLISVIKLFAMGFVLQFALSFYESLSGNIIGAGQGYLVIGKNSAPGTLNYAIANGELYRADILQDRFIGNAIWPQMSATLFPFLSIPFTGLLGQHNYWGAQLPFLNLMFFWGMIHTRKKYFLWMMYLCVFAAVMNTSRFGILAILATDMILLLRFKPQWRVPVSYLGLMLVLFVPFAVSSSAQSYWNSTQTLTGRFEMWPTMFALLADQGFSSVMLGLDSENSAQLNTLIGYYSFENLFLSLLNGYGLIGILSILTFFALFFKLRVRLNSFDRLILMLIFLNIVAISLISNHLFTYSIWIPVMILLTYVRWSADSGTIAVQAAPRRVAAAGRVGKLKRRFGRVPN